MFRWFQTRTILQDVLWCLAVVHDILLKNIFYCIFYRHRHLLRLLCKSSKWRYSHHPWPEPLPLLMSLMKTWAPCSPARPAIQPSAQERNWGQSKVRKWIPSTAFYRYQTRLPRLAGVTAIMMRKNTTRQQRHRLHRLSLRIRQSSLRKLTQCTVCCKSHKYELTAPPIGQTRSTEAKEMNMTSGRGLFSQSQNNDIHVVFCTVFWYCGICFISEALGDLCIFFYQTK